VQFRRGKQILSVSKGSPMSRSIIVLPDDSSKPILDAIADAAKSIRVKMISPSRRIETPIKQMLRNLLAVSAS
jgi:hypothetical protein